MNSDPIFQKGEINETSAYVPAHGCSHAPRLWLFLAENCLCSCASVAFEMTKS